MFNAIRHRIYDTNDNTNESKKHDTTAEQQSKDLLEHLLSQLKSQNEQLRHQVVTLQQELKVAKVFNPNRNDDSDDSTRSSTLSTTTTHSSTTLSTPSSSTLSTTLSTPPQSPYNEFEYWNRNYYIRSDPHRNACSNDIGFGLVERWRNAEKLICGIDSSITTTTTTETTTTTTLKKPSTTFTTTSSSIAPSKVLMYRIQQTRHVAQDNFIRILNMIVPLNSFSGNGFSNGWYANCEKDTSLWVDHDQRLFQLHLNHWMRAFRGSTNSNKIQKCDQIISKRLVLVQRDGEFNLFHSMTDFVNIFINYLMILGKNVQEGRIPNDSTNENVEFFDHFVKNSHIVLLDHYQKGYYYEILEKLGDQVFTHSEYKKYLQEEYPHLKMDSLVCFEEVLMVTPGGSCFLMKDAW